MAILSSIRFLAICLVGAWATPRVVSVPDLHGDYERAMQVLQAAGLVDSSGAWTGGTTTLVQTGDIADRGGDSLKIYRLFDQLAKEAPKSGGRVVNLLGNHELMCMQGDDRYVSKRDLEGFGGLSSWKQLWQPDGEIGKQVRKFKAAVKIDNLLFVHAGLKPEFLSGGRTLDDLNDAMVSALSGSHLRGNSNLLGDSGPLWTRYYADVNDPEVCRTVSEMLKRVGAVRMIVGHTIQERSPGEFRANSVCSGSLILGDTAISRAYGGEMSFIEYRPDGSAVVHYPGLNGLTDALPPSPLSVQESQREDAKVQVQKEAPISHALHAEAASMAADANAPTSANAYPFVVMASLSGVIFPFVLVLALLAFCIWIFRIPKFFSQKLRNP